MIFDFVKTEGQWDLHSLNLMLLEHVVQHSATIPTPLIDLGLNKISWTHFADGRLTVNGVYSYLTCQS